MQETIGWIGLGSMGHRMSRHLANAGYPLVVADALSTRGAPPGAAIAQSNAEVASRAATNLLSPASWITNLPAPVVINGRFTVTNSISGKQMFYRLSE